MYKVLSFGAHPDDIEIGCAGAELVLKEKGCEIYHGILTSGEEGAPDTAPSELARIREAEALGASKVLGVNQTKFFRFPDGISHFDKKMRVEVIRYIREVNPDIIFLHTSEDRSFDHIIVHNLVTAAIGPSQGPWYPELPQIKPNLKGVFGYEVWNPINSPGIYIDITKHIVTKIKCLEEHRSQLATVNYDKAVKGINQYRGALTQVGEFVEGFEVIQISAELDLSLFK